MKSDLEIFLETDLDLVGWIIIVDLLLKPVLAIRNIGVTEEAIRPALEYFTEEGFINYFGTQRFGTTGVPTHHVGKEMISSNFTKVIDLILKPREFENNFALAEARKTWADSGDPEKALEILRKGRKDRTVEGKLLYGLSKRHKNDQVKLKSPSNLPVT